MSLPKELRDQLLSGYLDDTLTSDERARVEQLLKSEPEMSEELAQLRNMRLSLQAIAAADSDIKLDPGFADRVLGAAVARARSEGYGEDHPLIRLSGHPSTPARTASGAPPWLYAGMMVALAASVMIAVVAFRPEATQDSSLALAPKAESTSQPEPPGVPNVVSDSTMMADSDSTPRVAPARDDVEIQPESTSSTVRPPESPPQPTDAIVRSEVPSMKGSVQPPAKSKIDVPGSSNGAILVLDVRRTVAGRQSRAVAAAMQFAGIGAASEKAITEEIVGVAKQARQSPDGDFSLLYLQASAKRLDRFYLRLVEDREGIESVGMSLAEDAPIMKMVRTLRSDPTLIRHDASLRLTSDDGLVGHFAGQLDQLQYIPLSEAALGVMPSEGPDVLAQILVLVR